MTSAVALFCILLLVYTYAGYPLLMLARAGLRKSRVERRSHYEPSVTVCLAVHNGEKHIARKLESLLELDYPKHKLEIVVYSDGATDQTEAIVRRFARSDSRIRLLCGAQRLGKPTALNCLRAAARGEVVIMCDVRQPFDSGAVRALVARLADPDVACVSGNLELAGASGAGAYWHYEKLIRSSESALGRMVGVSGSIYAIRRSDLPEVPADLILDDMWIPLRVAVATRRRIVLAETARAYESALDDEHEFPRKVRTLAGNYQLVAAMPALLVPILNPIWFELVSHKLLRLVCPWALLALFVASVLGAFGVSVHSSVEQELFGVLSFAQLAFYALALLGARAGRLGALARTFVVLNAAALAGFWRFLRGTQQVTW
jgi:cellulose synthase/poly-beta-1,6-N-acetylglucosamine synthase-like glycosyltransferase